MLNYVFANPQAPDCFLYAASAEPSRFRLPIVPIKKLFIVVIELGDLHYTGLGLLDDSITRYVPLSPGLGTLFSPEKSEGQCYGSIQVLSDYLFST